MPGRSRRPRYFRYELQPQAFELLLGLNPRLGRLEKGKWVPNYEEIARQGGVMPNTIRGVAGGTTPLTEGSMSALAGVAVLNGMSEDAARIKLFKHVDLRPARVRKGLRIVA